MKISGIYQIQSEIKKYRIYIGSAININRRKIQHLYDLRHNKHHSKKLQYHYNKYGESDLNFIILLECKKRDLLKKEQYYIDNNKPYFNCCSIAGSRYGMKASDESKLKMRNAKLNKYKGENHPRFGKKVSEETRIKLRNSKIGKKQSQETIAKRIAKTTGRKRTDETRLKISIANKGNGKWRKGKSLISKTTQYHQYIKDNIKIKTQKQISIELNVHPTTISKLLTKWKNQIFLV